MKCGKTKKKKRWVPGVRTKRGGTPQNFFSSQHVILPGEREEKEGNTVRLLPGWLSLFRPPVACGKPRCLCTPKTLHIRRTLVLLPCLASLFAPSSGAWLVKLSYIQLTRKLCGWLLQRLFLLLLLLWLVRL